MAESGSNGGWERQLPGYRLAAQEVWYPAMLSQTPFLHYAAAKYMLVRAGRFNDVCDSDRHGRLITRFARSISWWGFATIAMPNA